MNGRVIYFPYINIPESNWLIRTLLYWDKAGSIVPSDYIHGPNKLDNYMQELINANFVEPIIPMNHVYQIPRFTESFIELIDNRNFSRRRRGLISGLNTSRIHMEKMAEISKELEDRGLARHADYPWFDVEKSTANLFMAYLASVIGQKEKVSMIPITDRRGMFSLFSIGGYASYYSTQNASNLRKQILEEALPAPVLDVSVRDLAHFRDRYGSKLPAFRRYIETSILEINSISNVQIREQRIGLFKEQLNEDTKEIIALMKHMNWRNIVIGSFCAAASVTAASMTISASGLGETNYYLPILSGVSGLISAINLASVQSNERKAALKSPLAYLAFARTRLAKRQV